MGHPVFYSNIVRIGSLTLLGPHLTLFVVCLASRDFSEGSLARFCVQGDPTHTTDGDILWMFAIFITRPTIPPCVMRTTSIFVILGVPEPT